MKKTNTIVMIVAVTLIFTMLACSLSGSGQKEAADPGKKPVEPPSSSAEQPPKNEPAPKPGAQEAEVEPEPELVGGLTPGWHIYSNANHIYGLALYENTLWAAGLGGVVAWELDSGQYTKYTTLDGMGYLGAYDVEVCDIPETRIVVATEKGLSFFDPVKGVWDSQQITPEESNVGSNAVKKLYCDQANQRLLIGYAGLGVYNFSNGDWKQYTENEGLARNTVSDMQALGADLYVGSYKGVTKIASDGSLQVFDVDKGMPDEDIRVIMADGAGALWLGTSKGLARYQGGNWEIFNRDNTPDFPAVGITAMYFASDETLWIGTANETIAAFDVKSQSIKKVYKQPDGYKVSDLVVDSDGVVYYSTLDTGLYTLKGDEWQPMLVESDQLLSNFVSSLGVDQEGMLWVGTDRGAQRLDPAQADQAWQVFKAGADGPPTKYFKAMAVDPQKGMWFVHDGKWSSYYDGSAWQRFGEEQGLVGSGAAVAVSADGDTYIGSNEGLVVLGSGPARVFTEADGLPSKNIRSLLLDGDTLWIGTVDGLARLKELRIEVELPPKAPGLTDDNIGVLFKHPDGSLLLGTPAGLVRYAQGELETILSPEPVRTMFFGQTTRSISDIAMHPDGSLWVSTYVGLYHGDGQNWEQLSTLDGLPTNNINALAIDNLWTLWVAGGYTDAGGALARYVPGGKPAKAEPPSAKPEAEPTSEVGAPAGEPEAAPTQAAEAPQPAAPASEVVYDQNSGLPVLSDATEVYSTDSSLNYWTNTSFEAARDFYLQQLPFKGWILDIDEKGNCIDKDRCTGWRGYDDPDNQTWFFIQGKSAYMTLNLIPEGDRVNVIFLITWDYK